MASIIFQKAGQGVPLVSCQDGAVPPLGAPVYLNDTAYKVDDLAWSASELGMTVVVTVSEEV